MKHPSSAEEAEDASSIITETVFFSYSSIICAVGTLGFVSSGILYWIG